ncbi:MAG TPA: S41 family peptidase [Bryobacteraceae bacterium]|jgi:carboxyl-terminal processing protease|nr:S41 family peptidase [Bryobacteraceae bacterium]
MFLPLLFLFAAPPNTADLDSALKRFTELISVVETEAADPVNTQQAVYQGAIPGMLRTLDPHSIFFDPDQNEQLKQMENSERKGFGTVVSVLPGRVIILQALPGSPSAKAGLQPGDEIVAVNGIVLARLEFDQIIGYLGESHQHRAQLFVRRPTNARPLEFVLDPELLDSPSVDRAFLLQSGIGYIRVTGFDPQTAKQLKDAIENLGGEKLKALVLDLRDNPGGVVQTALEAASYFLQPGQKLLSVKGRSLEDQSVDVPKTAAPYSFPVAVLVNEKTASAAEILTGALQDHDRAVVLGEPSFGKGLVQNVFPLHGNTALALTTAFYYTPSGRSIQKPLPSGHLEIEKQVEQFHTDSGRTVTGGGGIQPDIFVAPEAQTRLRVALDASGMITSFATEFIDKHKIEADFEVSASVLEEFQVYAGQRNIQPSVGEWATERGWLQSRLKQEIFNQALGVAKGDEVEEQRDPVVRAAVEKLVTRL